MAKLYPSRKIKGMKKCGNSCTACPYILEVKDIRINKNKKWILNKNFSCGNLNIIYMIECNKENCKENRYIGETGRILRHRLADHRGYVVNNTTTISTGAHFNLPVHSLSNMRIIILEQVRKSDISYRKERERYFINKFDTFNRGMNRQM